MNLFFIPFSLFPDEYATTVAFDPSLTGSWTIAATDGVQPTSALTPPITDPKLIPLVTGLHVIGTGLTPTVEWTLPDLSGLSVDRLFVRVFDLNRDVPLTIGGSSSGSAKDFIFDSSSLAPTTTSFVIPSGVLEFGGRYSFNLVMDDLATVQGFGTSPSNRSETWSDPFSPVPEPATILLLGTTAAGLGLARWRQRRRKQQP